MKNILLAVVLLSLFFCLFGSQGDYQRKSISSVESVWLQRGALRSINTFPYHFFDKMVDFYIELPRFDYNELPEALLEDFRNQANSLSNITPDNLATVLNLTVAEKIKEILEDPVVREARASDLKDESWRATFAGSKGRSMGLTVEEIERLMNSAYIYLPYITRFELKRKGDEIETEIRGGIIWYQVQVAPNGDVSMVLRLASETNATGFADKNPKQVMGMRADYTKFRWGNDIYNVTEEEYAQYDAIQAWAKNLSVKTKEIDEFNISGQIVERRPGRIYGSPIGKREGLHLDDGFFIIETYETSDGEIKSKNIGFTRLMKNADNTNNPDEMSLFKQYLGKTASPGMVLKEHPRLGIDIRFKAGYQTGIDIPKNYTRFNHPLVGTFNVLKEDAKEQLFFAVDFAYNLAPIFGVSQMFMELEGSFGIPMAKYEPNISSSLAYTVGAYTGLSKKWWLGRNSLHLNGKIGYDRLVLDGEFLSYDYKYTINAYGLKSGLHYNYMLTPDLIFKMGADYKIGFKPTGVSFEFNDETIIDYNSTQVADIYPDLRLGGLMLNVGLSYSFGELPVNLFGFLDPLKRH